MIKISINILIIKCIEMNSLRHLNMEIKNPTFEKAGLKIFLTKACY